MVGILIVFYPLPLLDNYSTITRQLLNNYSTITRQLLVNYSTITRQLLVNYSPVTLQLLSNYSPTTLQGTEGTDTVLKTKLFGLKVRHFNNSCLLIAFTRSIQALFSL